jgi:hypothetical protein
MLGRRSFLITCGWMVAAPALAKVQPPSTTMSRPGAPPVDPLPPQTDGARLEVPVLQIEGWETPLISEKSEGSQVWISINQSWRTAWR